MTIYGSYEPSKIIIVGEASVGKTSILDRWLHNTFYTETAPTIGAGMSPVKIMIDGSNHLFHVWDTAGTPQFRSVVPMYCRQAAIALIVFDVTKEETFNKVDEWVKFVRENASPLFILIGNKIDLADQRVINAESGRQLAEMIDAKYLEVSACTNEGINTFVQMIVEVARESFSFLQPNSTENEKVMYPFHSDSKCNC